MQEYFKRSLPSLEGINPATISTIVQGSSLSQCFTSINAFNTMLVDKLNASKMLVDAASIFVHPSDYLADHTPIFKHQDVDSCIGIIESDDVDLVYDFLDAYDEKSYMLTDRTGRQFPFHLKNGGLYEDENVIVYITTSSDPSNLEKALLWKDKVNDVIKYHELIYTVDSVIDSQDVEFENCMRDAAIICELQGHYNYRNTLGSRVLLGTGVYRQNILTMLQDRLPDANITNIKQGISLLEELITSGQSHINISTVYDLIHDQLESSAVNEFLQTLSSSIVQGKLSNDYFAALQGSEMVNKYESVKNAFSSAWRIFQDGGVRAVISYVLEFGKIALSSDTDDGLLTFTDNSNYVPVIYLAGLVETAIYLATTAAAIIISAYSKVLGAIVAVLGYIGSMIFKKLSYDQSATRIGINVSPNVNNDALPIASGQFEVNIPLGSDSFMVSIINEYLGLCSIEVPGGYLFLGPGEFNDDGSIAKIRYEFHPSTVNPITVVNLVKNKYFRNITYYNDGSAFEDVLNMSYEYLAVGEPVRDFISRNWVAANLQGSYYDNDTDDYGTSRVDPASDMFIRMCASANTALFLLWLHNPYGYHHDSYRHWVGHNVSGFWIDDNISDIMAYIVGYLPSMSIFTHSFPNSCVFAADWKFFIARANATIPLIAEDSSVLHLLMESKHFYGSPKALSQHQEYMWVMPEYDSSTFIFSLVSAIVISAAVAVAATVISTKVKKYRRRQAAIRAAKAELAHQNFVENPTAENYKIYSREVLKNNLSTYVYGGDKVSYANYWGEVSGSSDGITVSSLLSSIGSKNDKITLSDIAFLITGRK